MNTYRVTEDWPAFEQFIINNLRHVNKGTIGFMHRGNEIIIRSHDESVLDIIRKQYPLTPCEQPSNVLDKDRGWAYWGNARLFDTKL
jgi:hypothetical protein